jgi:hypothetical protein
VIPLLRALPIAFAPVHGETIGSYLNRLADANRLKVSTVSTALDLSRRYRRDDDTCAGWTQHTLTRLAVLTNRHAASPANALPALHNLRIRPSPRSPASGVEPPQAPRRPACRPCMARHGTGLVIRSTPYSECVCRQHRRWLHSLDQHHLNRLPEVLVANTRHRGLAHNRTRSLNSSRAYLDAQRHTQAWFHTASQPEPQQRWIQRLGILGEDPYGDPHRPTTERIEIVTYPETVVLTSLLVSPYWHQRDDLLAEAGRRLGIQVQENCHLP